MLGTIMKILNDIFAPLPDEDVPLYDAHGSAKRQLGKNTPESHN